jgi:uncharacterized protein YbcV (DUF1398 family)
VLFDKFVTVERRTVSGAYNNLVLGIDPAFGQVPVNIQPMQAEFKSGGMSYKNYKVFTTNSGIVEGMRLTVVGTGEKFIVRGRQRFDYIVLPHYELVVEGDTQ